ncbi:serine/arginine-rich splicing factor 4-like [Dermacentor albipictus]|uniref:serine/arginine-rich splicing factor 4-like n=1 Tax=Dermacentor albipictus TaxID=60249 RepID=UPI0038FC35EC
MPSAAVHRADSTRSDNSDASGRSAESRGSAGKKVSFSRAVRVKKFPRRHEGSSNSVSHAGNGDVPDSAQAPPSPEKKFWFKVYKNRHHHDKSAGGGRIPEEPPLPLETTVSDSSGHHHHHHVRGASSVARSASSASASRSPRRRPDSPVVKRNHVRRIVQKFDREATLRHDPPASSSRESSPPPPPVPPPPSVVRSYSVEEYTRPGTPIELQRSPAPKRSNRLVDGVKVILAPLTRKKSSASKKEVRSAGTGTLVREEDFEEVNNNENKENEPVEEEEELPVMVDKATQVKPFDLEEFFATSGDVSHLYSQVDKSKKTTTFKTPEIHVHHPEVVVDYPITSSPRYVERDYEYYDRSRASSSSPTPRRGGDVSTTPEPEYGSIRRVKSSSRSFGFNLGRWEHDDSARRRDSDTSSVNSEPGILGGHRDGSRPGSVLKAYDSKKRELSYENVPARVSDNERSRTGSPTTSTSGVWVRDIDKDYRRGMADADVTVPSSGYVFTYTASLGGGDRSSKKKTTTTTTTKSSSRDASPTLLDNGSLPRGHRRSPSRGPRSVSSDQTSVRGGLAAAYQARQARAAASSSNGRVSKSSSPRSPRIHASSPGRSAGAVSSGPGSVQGSVAGSVTSEPAYQRDTVVLYIPGVSHHSTPSEDSLRVSRSQSVLNKDKSASRSASKSGHKSKSSSSSSRPKRAASESDIRRTKSVPKGAKFPWLRIKPTVTATPVH